MSKGEEFSMPSTKKTIGGAVAGGDPDAPVSKMDIDMIPEEEGSSASKKSPLKGSYASIIAGATTPPGTD